MSLIFVCFSRKYILLKNIKKKNILSIQPTKGVACVYHSSPMPTAWGSGGIFLLSLCLMSSNFISPSSIDSKAHCNEYKYACYIKTVTVSPTSSAPVGYISMRIFNKASFYHSRKRAWPFAMSQRLIKCFFPSYCK